MRRRERQQGMSSESAKALEAGSDLESRPPLNSSSTSSSIVSSSSTAISQTSSASTTTKKKRKWYKPKIKLNLHKDWIWVGFISAGDTTPRGRGRNQNVKPEGDDNEWEQLPAYAPPQRPMVTTDATGTFEGDDDWIVPPTSSGLGQGRRDISAGAKPPAYW